MNKSKLIIIIACLLTIPFTFGRPLSGDERLKVNKISSSQYNCLAGNWRCITDSTDIINFQFYPDSNQLVMSPPHLSQSKFGISRSYLFAMPTPESDTLKGVLTAWGATNCTLYIKSSKEIQITYADGCFTYLKMPS